MLLDRETEKELTELCDDVRMELCEMNLGSPDFSPHNALERAVQISLISAELQSTIRKLWS